MKRKITLFSMCCFVSLLSFAAQNIYISPAGDDDGDGTQVSPYATLSKASSVVSEDGAVIYVAAGTYVFAETAVIGAFDQTIVGEDAATTVFDGDNAVAFIDGVTAMQSSGKSLTVQKIAFKNGKMNVSTVETGGAAIRMGMKTNLTAEDCYFYNNRSESTNNITTWGGAIYFCGNEMTVDRCFFEENSSKSNANEGYGGAIVARHLFNLGEGGHLVAGATNATIKNSTFYKNHCKSKGGAVYFNKQLNDLLDDEDATFVVQNCVFLENTGGKDAQLGAAIALSSGTNSANNKMQTIILTNNTLCNNYMKDDAGVPKNQNTVLLEGFRYVSYMANNLITSDVSETGFTLFANQPTPIEYGRNNIIDLVNANINGTDFTTDAAVMNNELTAVTPEDLVLNTSLSYPIGATFNVPYLEIGKTSPAVDTGVNSYVVNTVANPAPADPIEYVLQSDIQGSDIENDMRDVGAFEFSSGTSIANNRSDATISIVKASNGLKIFNLQQDDVIRVFNMHGMLISSNQAVGSQFFLPLSTKGLYLISINGKSSKILF